MKAIEGAEIIIYADTGEEISIELDHRQILVVGKALGLKFADMDEASTSYSCFGPNALEQILAGEINPFRLREV